MGSGRVEGFGTYCFKLQPSHHGVEEDLQKGHVIAIGGLHDLDPLDLDLVLGAFVLTIENREVSSFAETVNAGAPVDVELQLLLDLVSATSEHVLAEFARVVRDLRLKLDGVLVDALDACLVEVDLEVVGVQLESSAGGFGISCWSLREKGECVGG